MPRSRLRRLSLERSRRMTLTWVAIVALAGLVLFLLLHLGEREQRAAEDRLSTHSLQPGKDARR